MAARLGNGGDDEDVVLSVVRLALSAWPWQICGQLSSDTADE